MGSQYPQDTQHLVGLARRRAFETYLRFGRQPDRAKPVAKCKTNDPSAPVADATPSGPTRFYVWRSAEDDRVRHSHAARDGQVFAWSEPPAGGHPGTEPNCRCWAAPYYGDPSIPDELQPLKHAVQLDTSGNQVWSSIETLTRPDGSLAQSRVVAHDGTIVESRFQATSVTRAVTLADGQTLRIDTESGLQSVYLGSDSVPLFQSRWTASGPKVIRARQHLAFLLDRDPINGILNPQRPELDGAGGSGLGASTVGLTTVYAILQAAPASQGLGAGDEPVLAIKAWTVDGETRAVPILAGSLTEEQLRQHCRFLPDVQTWTDAAAALLAEQKPILLARTWGSLVHGAIKRTIDALKASIPFIYRNLHPEISYSPDTTGTVPYSQKGSTRLDVVEDRSEDLGAVCNYDVKTGREGLTPKRLTEIAQRLSARYPGAVIYIIEVRPMP